MMRPKGLMSVAAALWICVAILAPTSRAACPPFHAPLESAVGVGANGGTISSPVSFSAAVKANGACVGEPGSIRYTGSLFDAESGSVSLWFKKSASDSHGGILQIGQLGQAGSLSIFFNDQDDLYVELRTDTDSDQLWAPDIVSAVQYIHIVATWETRSDGIYLKLFVDGEYRTYKSLSGAYAPSSGTLDVGRAGADPWYGSARGCIDEVTVADWPLEDSEVYAEYVYSAGRYVQQGTGCLQVGRDRSGAPSVDRGNARRGPARREAIHDRSGRLRCPGAHSVGGDAEEAAGEESRLSSALFDLRRYSLPLRHLPVLADEGHRHGEPDQHQRHREH